jgi:hypothetical protein
MDRCALFVDAGYVLADGAMAVHGTRRRDSVSWDYPGILKLLAGISRDRTGLALLRCYWYEATVGGRRTPEHDTLADLPGLKLRLGRMRPGHREGVESEIHRDLITLARNNAVCDAVIVSAEEDLAQVIAEVQDLGVRVILLHITMDGTWTISRPLREECDDIVEISGAHLRPFVDLIAGAEPAGLDEQYPNGGYPARTLANGHGSNLGALTHQGLPAAALPAGAAIYAAPVIGDQQRGAQPRESVAPDPRGQQAQSQPQPQGRSDAPRGAGYRQPGDAQGQDRGGRDVSRVQQQDSGGMHEQAQADRGRSPSPSQETQPARMPEQSLGGTGLPRRVAGGAPGHAQAGLGGIPGPAPGESGAQRHAQGGSGMLQAPAERETGMSQRQATVPGLAGLPGLQNQAQPPGQAAGQPPAPGQQQTVSLPSRQPQVPDQALAQMPGQMQAQVPGHPQAQMPGQMQAQMPGPPASQGQYTLPGQAPQGHSQHALPGQVSHGQAPGQPPLPGQPGSAGQGQQAGGHARRDDEASLSHGHRGYQQPDPLTGRPQAHEGVDASASATLPGAGRQPAGIAQHYLPAPDGGFSRGIPGPPSQAQFAGPHGAASAGPVYLPPGQPAGPYGGPQPAPAPPPGAISLTDAVQAAHAEGFGFGEAVARDAPALWLEAVLARKPRMPSDLEARLLQGSALPIDSLLHDEVRHALRRGFWDALERSRR